MKPHSKRLYFLALGGMIVLASAWAFATTGLWGSPAESKATVHQQTQQSALPPCCQQRSSGCCQKAEGVCCCGLPSADQSCPQAVSQKKPDKEEMKASPEAMAKGVAARKAAETHRKALAKDGVHSCCIKPSCVFCAAAGDMCPCAMNLGKGMPVCPECWGGWQAGFGRLEGVDPAKVQIAPKEKLKMMYEMKAKNFQKAQAEGK